MKKKEKLSIRHWADDDKPREKLIRKGRLALSDAELLTILIRAGDTKRSALDLSKEILSQNGNNLNQLAKLSVKDLCGFHGIGPAKAISIVAALELGRRKVQEELIAKKVIRGSKDAFDYFLPYLVDLRHEEFWILLLNRANKIITHCRISEGGVSGTLVDPKIIFKHALDHLATSIILCHNHPSGNIMPSDSDIKLTKNIKEAGRLLEINVLDHIIIGDKDYYSLADHSVV